LPGLELLIFDHGNYGVNVTTTSKPYDSRYTCSIGKTIPTRSVPEYVRDYLRERGYII
jgi:hypothetical protein